MADTTPPSPALATLTGWFGIGEGDYERTIEGDLPRCAGRGEFGDLVRGADVIVLDNDGMVIGRASLTEGEVLVQAGVEICAFTVSVDVGDASFYDIRVADRAGDVFTRAELEAAGWEATLTLGLRPPAQPPSTTPTPAPIEVSGQLSVSIDGLATDLTGEAGCQTEPGGRRIASIRAFEVGRVGGHRVYASLDLEPLSDGRVYIELGQGGEGMSDGQPRSYAGDIAAIDAEVEVDRIQGSLGFAGLTAVEPFVGVDWPRTIAGRVDWRCDDPALVTPDPYPGQHEEPQTTGSATLTGAITGTFEIQGGDCPTPDSPIGFMTSSGTIDGRPAILEISFPPETVPMVGFALYRTPGDKYDLVRGLAAPVTIEPADDGGSEWHAQVEIAAESIGPVKLDVEWECGI